MVKHFHYIPKKTKVMQIRNEKYSDIQTLIHQNTTDRMKQIRTRGNFEKCHLKHIEICRKKTLLF